ncbi:MAG: UUP1 family membrane protein [Burkholderiaceae bacterium]
MKNSHVYMLSIGLTFLGLLIFVCKLAFTGLPVKPGELATAWNIEHQLEFDADGGPVKAVVNVPPSSLDKAVVRERVVSTQYGLSRGRDELDNRVVTLTTRDAQGPQVIYLTSLVHKYRGFEEAPKVMLADVKLPKVSVDGAALTAAREMLGIAEARSADNTSLVTTLLGLLDVGALADNLTTLTGGETGLRAKVDAAVAILGLRNLSARRVNGVKLTGSTKTPEFTYWLEVLIDQQWVAFSAGRATSIIDDDLFPWWRGTYPLVSVEGAKNVESRISIVRIEQRVLDQVLSGNTATPVGKEFLKLSLFGLPLATQNVFKVLMVVPIGILVLVLIRNVVGIKSLGTFMPVLIALALHQTHVLWGAMIFTFIVALGLLFRFYLEHLKLLLVPRLAAVLTFVVLVMAMMSVVTHALGFVQGLSVALFPMVILTMTIERISVLWDERGAGEAIKQSLSSLVIAMLLCILISFPILEHLFFTFPELHLIVIAALLLLGRYTGYRLLELPRFRELSREAD